MSKSLPLDLRVARSSKPDQYLIPHRYQPFIESIVVPQGQIVSRVDRLAYEISQKYAIESADLLALGVLNGAIKFFADLLHNKEMQAPFEMETCKASSYVGEKSSGKVEFNGFDFSKVKRKAVLVIEDIMDTGLTLDSLYDEIRRHNPKSVEIVCLLEKPERRNPQIAVHSDYVGFIIPDYFVVGYGLDYNNRFRGLPHLCVLKKEVYQPKSL